MVIWLDKHTQEVLLYINNFTDHVLDERGYPAKLPLRFLEATFTDHLKLRTSLQLLYSNKLITSFVWGDSKKGNAVRTTSKGQTLAFTFSEEKIGHVKKRQLIIEGNTIKVRDLE